METVSFLPVLSESFQVRSFDIGSNRLMRLSSLCGYLQEVAGKHATNLGVGYRFVHESGLVWVLSKLCMQISRLPGWGENFTVETWPLGNERIFYRRDYLVNNEHGIQVRAASYWILLDIKTKKPVVVPIDTEVVKLNTGKFSMHIPSEAISAIKSDNTKIREVRYSDLDQNNHVNNARYVEWVFDNIDSSIVETSVPSFFAIEYKHEVRAGESVKIRNDQINTLPVSCNLDGVIQSTGQLCFKAKVIF